jgi:thiol-disulfide isomerase/thioredoxin
MPEIVRNPLVVMLLLVTLPALGADKLALIEARLGENFDGKVVVVDFWASWCVPCRRSFPWMNSMQKKYAERDLVIVAVNVDREREAAKRFLAEFPAEFRVHYDHEAILAKQFGVKVMPSTFVIGRDGAVIARHRGFKVHEQDEYEAALVDAMGNQ